MSLEEKNELATNLATAKAKSTSTAVSKHLNGQAWYLESLVVFSALTAEEQISSCSSRKFAEMATKLEMEDVLKHSGRDQSEEIAGTAKRLEMDELRELEIDELRELQNSHKKEIQLDDLFIPGETHEIFDEDYPYALSKWSSNGKLLLKSLKAKTTTISEKEIFGTNFYDNSKSICNVYEYKGLVVTVTSSSPRSGKHTSYKFTCSYK